MHIGTSDPMIQHNWGFQTATNLLLKDIDVQFRSYEGVMHELSAQQVSHTLRVRSQI